MRRICSIIAALTLAVGSFNAFAQNPVLPNDPSTKVGRLENGLAYYIRHNDKPENRAEFYLATNAGAINETPDQDGLAHFLEHMCFNGTKNFPDKLLLDWLQSIGASFGGNVNASTGVDQTQYMLNNIPLHRESVIDSCLLVLHDYSAFVTCDPVEIDKERPVIIEERRTRRNASWRTFERSLPYLYGDSKYATCTLIGSQENLESFKPESLVNFYKTWYRPDNQAVIVVGDVDVDAVEAKIKSIWADIPAPAAPLEKTPILFTPFSEPRVAVLTDPETTVPSVEVLWEKQAEDISINGTVAGYSMDLIKYILYSVMSERFTDIAVMPDAPFTGADFSIGSICKAFEAVIGSASLKEENILGGFETLMTEIERVRRYGITEPELLRAKEKYLSICEKAANQAESRKNPEFVRPLIENFFKNKPYMDPATELEVAKAVLGQLNAAMLNQMLPYLLVNENLVIIYSGPLKEGISTPTRQQLLDVVSKVASSEISAPAEESGNEPLMDPSAISGSPIVSSGSTIYGSTEWTLANGVKVIVRPTEYKKDQIIFNIFKDGGQSLISTEDMASFDDNIYSVFKSTQGVAGFKSTALMKMLAGKNVSVNSYIDPLKHGIRGNSTVKDLETAMQLLYLEYVEPRFDEEEWAAAIAQLSAVVPNLESRPDVALQKKIVEDLFSNNPRKEFISMDKLSKASLKTVEDNYRRLFADAAGAVMVIVGDVDLDVLQPLVEKYVGSIPAGKKAFKINKKNFIELKKGTNSDVFNTDMETPLSTVLQVYSSYRPYSVEEETTYDAISYILDQIYVDTLREEEGGTYGASTNASCIRTPFGRQILQVAFTCKPSMSENLRKIAIDGFRKLGEEGPTDEQFKRTIENFKKKLPEDRINNNYWMGCIMDYVQYDVDANKESEAAIESLSKESIRKMAAKMFKSGNFIEIVQMPGNTSEKE